MTSNFNSFIENLQNKKIAFIGTGISNLSVIKTFIEKSKHQLNLTILDSKSEDDLNEQSLKLKEKGINFICGKHYLNNLNNFDLIIRSPGVYFNKPEIQNAIKHGVVVTSELELFFEFCPCKIIAITGSDGKTTTTSLIFEMLKTQGFTVHLGGNIGIGLLCKIDNINKTDFAVVELSSFQLISMRQSPQIAIITNIAKNHLDVHANMEEYVDAKLNILLHQNAFSTTILNADDDFYGYFKNKTRGFVKSFSVDSKVENGAFYNKQDGNIYHVINSRATKVLNAQQIQILGLHNIKNYLAAISAVFNLVSTQTIEKVAKNFKGVEHRLELIAQKNDVRWFNDSIATTPSRTIAGLNCFNEKVILIAGGYDKKIPFDQLAIKIVEKVKVLILLGSTAGKIKKAVMECPGFDENSLVISEVENLKHAVQLSHKLSEKGDCVVFSPACASFDMFENFEQRGHIFKNLVKLTLEKLQN